MLRTKSLDGLVSANIPSSSTHTATIKILVSPRNFNSRVLGGTTRPDVQIAARRIEKPGILKA